MGGNRARSRTFGCSSEIQRVTVPSHQVQFGDVRSIPQTAPGAAAVVGGNDRIRERGRDHLVGAEIELMQDVPVGRVKEHGIVRKIVGHQQLVTSLP